MEVWILFSQNSETRLSTASQGVCVSLCTECVGGGAGQGVHGGLHEAGDAQGWTWMAPADTHRVQQSLSATVVPPLWYCFWESAEHQTERGGGNKSHAKQQKKHQSQTRGMRSCSVAEWLFPSTQGKPALEKVFLKHCRQWKNSDWSRGKVWEEGNVTEKLSIDHRMPFLIFSLLKGLRITCRDKERGWK